MAWWWSIRPGFASQPWAGDGELAAGVGVLVDSGK